MLTKVAPSFYQAVSFIFFSTSFGDDKVQNLGKESPRNERKKPEKEGTTQEKHNTRSEQQVRGKKEHLGEQGIMEVVKASFMGLETDEMMRLEEK